METQRLLGVNLVTKMASDVENLVQEYSECISNLTFIHQCQSKASGQIEYEIGEV